MSSTEVLEANVASIRTDLNELKTDLRAETKSLREKVDRNFEKLQTEIKETNKALGELSKLVLKIDSRLSAVPLMAGGLVALVTLAITVGKAFNWF